MIIPIPWLLPIPYPLHTPHPSARRESREDRELRLRGKRLREINSKKVPTMEEENEKRVLIGYPHLLEVVKERCPKCKGKMWHDNFQKCWDMKTKHLKACYQCINCEHRVLFDLFTNKFDNKPFGDAKVEGEEINGI